MKKHNQIIYAINKAINKEIDLLVKELEIHVVRIKKLTEEINKRIIQNE